MIVNSLCILVVNGFILVFLQVLHTQGQQPKIVSSSLSTKFDSLISYMWFKDHRPQEDWNYGQMLMPFSRFDATSGKKRLKVFIHPSGMPYYNGHIMLSNTVTATMLDNIIWPFIEILKANLRSFSKISESTVPDYIFRCSVNAIHFATDQQV